MTQLALKRAFVLSLVFCLSLVTGKLRQSWVLKRFRIAWLCACTLHSPSIQLPNCLFTATASLPPSYLPAGAHGAFTRQELLNSTSEGYEGPPGAAFSHYTDLLDVSSLDSTFMEEGDFQGSLLVFTDQVSTAFACVTCIGVKFQLLFLFTYLTARPSRQRSAKAPQLPGRCHSILRTQAFEGLATGHGFADASAFKTWLSNREDAADLATSVCVSEGH